ncbi:MAG: glycosyltransferase [Acidobacteria bacterium]|nr:MAG: glycosyltransferase [Acidobacteriota bacterium]
MVDPNESTNLPLLNGARVVIVIGPFDLGGAERQALLLARYLAREQNARVEMWGMRKPGRVSDLCDKYGIPWRVAPIPLDWHPSRPKQLARLLKFAWALRSAKADVILPFMFYQSVACALVWRLAGARAFVWNQRCEGRDRLGPAAEKLAVRLTPYFIANSVHGSQFLNQKLGAPPDRIRVVYNGVEPAPAERDRAAWRAELGVTDDCFLACMVANLQLFKDHATLLRAWRIVVDRLKEMGRQAVLLLAGRFDHTHERLKVLAYDLDLGRTVRFLGGVSDVSGLLSAVDLGVHSSINEGCPNGVLECMAAGLAVVGTDYAGIREAVGPAGFPFLAEPKNPEALAEQILRLALDPELRRKAGETNRRRITAEFSPYGMYQNVMSVIGEAMGGARSGEHISSSRLVLGERHQSSEQ